MLEMKEQIRDFDEHFSGYISERTCRILPQENSEEYRKAREEEDQILEQLRAALPADLHKLLNNLGDRYSLMAACEGELMFMAGFLDGIFFASKLKRARIPD